MIRVSGDGTPTARPAMRRAALSLLLPAILSLTGRAAEPPVPVADFNPYYVNRTYPKLITPPWVGEGGGEAVGGHGIDGRREPKKWESDRRPILPGRKKIDGRAPVSIMTCKIEPNEPHLQAWLKEGLSLETHTFDHPCPLLKDGD